jgi:hypothetical protein
MNFTPKTDEEIAKEGLLPEATYQIDIIKAEDAVSKNSGNDMIKLTIGVWNDGEIASRVIDYVMPSCARKLKTLCDAIGIGDKYKSGVIRASDFEGRSCLADIKTEIDKNGKYPPKNGIKAYLASPVSTPAPSGNIETRPATQEETDGCPF